MVGAHAGVGGVICEGGDGEVAGDADGAGLKVVAAVGAAAGAAETAAAGAAATAADAEATVGAGAGQSVAAHAVVPTPQEAARNICAALLPGERSPCDGDAGAVSWADVPAEEGPLI